MILVPDLADIVRTATSDAERRVARLLSSIEGPEEAVAFHSMKLRSHPYMREAEADFVILWDNVVIVVEVKGGGIRQHEGKWYTVDRYSDWHSLGRSPMEQARSAKFALRDILKQEGFGWFADDAIVITPDTQSPPRAIGWQPENWLANDHMTISDLTKALQSVATAAKKPPAGTKLASAKALRQKLFGEFTLMPIIDLQRGAVLEEQNRATDEQARVLASLSRNQRVMVLGGAGTGKSLLLVEAAKQEAASGRTALITFHSPALVDYFNPFMKGRDIAVQPFQELRGDTKYDVVLIDEAQDLMTDEAMDQLDAVVAGGRSAGRWRMFLDPNNQAHVDGRFDKEVFDLVSEEALLFDLNLNVRNTRAIVHVVQEYLGADVGDPGIVHGEAVHWETVAEPADAAKASEVANELIANGIGKSQIWIIRVSGDAEPTINADGVIVTCPRYVKGFEAEHVIVCDLPETFNDETIASLYVAVTRARVSLRIVASTEDRRRLQELTRHGG
jgi:hypothetical protein